MRACSAATARPDPDGPGAEPVPGYRLIARVGSGGAGDVWCAEAPGGLRVALKIVRLSGGLGRREMANIRILRAIRHPNLLAYFGAWQLEDRLIIGMELADRSLWDRFAEARAGGLAGIPLGELVDVMGEAARVIDFLNEPSHQLEGRSGVAIHHRDIKPQNIMLIGRGVKVADFGLSCLDDASGASRSQCGLTFAYAAPETFRRRVAGTSDQYSLAVTFCQLRGGRLPFVGPPSSVMMGHLFGDPDLSMLPERERPIVARAMAKDPAARWPDCRSFVKALAGCLEAESPDLLPRAAEDPQGAVRSSCSVEVPPLPSESDRSIAVWPDRLTGADGEGDVSAYCLDVRGWDDPGVVADDASSSSPTVVVAATEETVTRRHTRRLLLAAASLLAAGVAAWTWSWRPVSRAGIPPMPSRMAVRAPSTPSRAGAAGAIAPPRGRRDPRVPADLGLADAPPPPVHTPSARLDRARVNPSPVPVASAARLPDLAAWAPLIHQMPAIARTWLATILAARRPDSSASHVVASAQPARPVPTPDVHIGMPASLELEAGRSLSIPIRVDRGGRDGPLAIHFEGLPAGVTMPDLTIAAGRAQGEALIQARLDASSATVPVVMSIRAGSAHARVPLQLRVRANPAMLYRTRGHTLLACGRPAEAAAAFTRPLEAGVVDPFVYNNRGLAYASMNQLDLAIRDYTEASRLRPADPAIRYNRGIAFARRGDDFRALLDFDTAIRLKPDYARAFAARARIYLKQGDKARACADSSRASELARAAARPEERPPSPSPPPSH